MGRRDAVPYVHYTGTPARLRAGGCRSLPLSIAESGKNGKPYAVSKGRSAASTPLYFRVR